MTAGADHHAEGNEPRLHKSIQHGEAHGSPRFALAAGALASLPALGTTGCTPTESPSIENT
jgi:hypothetical protein